MQAPALSSSVNRATSTNVPPRKSAPACCACLAERRILGLPPLLGARVDKPADGSETLRTSVYALIAVLVVVSASLVGCDGIGWPIALKRAPVDSGDQTPEPGEEGEEPTEDEGEPVEPPTTPEPPQQVTFGGAWMATYADDFPSDEGQQQYAIRLTLTQSGNALNGTGRLFRVFRTGATAATEIPVAATGLVDTTGLDATLTVSLSQTGRVTWHVRATQSGMVGIYHLLGTDGAIQRMGHAHWYRIRRPGIEGPWVSAFGDDFGNSALPARNRTAAIVLSGSGSLFGRGSFDEQAPDQPDRSPLGFDVAGSSLVADSQVGLTFGGSQLGGNEYDWYGFADSSRIAAAYAQFQVDGELCRFGHALWRASPEVVPDDVTHTWVTAFSDSVTAIEGTTAPDFLAVVTLDAQSGGLVVGSLGRVLTESDASPSFQSYNATNSNLLGSRLVLDLNGRYRFAWDMRLADDVMAGSYQRLVGGEFAGSGNAEWRPLTEPDLAGSTWAAAYIDTVGEMDSPVTQLALVTITRQDAASLGGTGALRFAGETRRRVFTVTGSLTDQPLSGREITWRWQGGVDFFGDTIWHLRQAGDYLYGTYTNFTAQDAVEFRGHAVFVRSQETTYFNQ